MRKIVGSDCTLIIEDGGWVRFYMEDKEKIIGKIHNGIFEFSRTPKLFVDKTKSWALTKELVDHSKSLGIEVFFLNTGVLPGGTMVRGCIARKRLKQLIKLGKIRHMTLGGYERQYHIPVRRWRTEGPLYDKYVKLLKD